MQGIYGVSDSGKVYAKVMGTQVKLRLSLLDRNMMSFPNEATLDFILEEQEGVCFPGEGEASTSNHRRKRQISGKVRWERGG